MSAMFNLLKKHCTKITLGVFLGFAYWQGTTDGLWFWCALAYLVTRRWRVSSEEGGRFIRGMKKGQSIWHYGLYNTVVSFIQEHPATSVPISALDIGRRWAGTWFFVMFVLHIYIAAFIALKHALPEQMNVYLHMTTEPCMPVLNKWYSFHWIVEKLTNRGYPDRALLVAHVYVAVVLAWVCSTLYLYWYAIWHIIRVKELERVYYDYFRIKARKFTKWKSPQGNIILFMLFPISICVGLAFFCWFMLITPTFFPDEIAADWNKRVKYAFLINYVYKSDMGLFCPAYMGYSYLMVFSMVSLIPIMIILVLALQLVQKNLSSNH